MPAEAMIRARRLNQRHIPWAFTDLVAAAFQFLPNRSGEPVTEAHAQARARHLAELRQAVCAAGGSLVASWPDAARDLFRRCEAIVEGEEQVIPAGLITNATEIEWPDPRAARWQGRADIA
jgi:hypothetical protein